MAEIEQKPNLIEDKPEIKPEIKTNIIKGEPIVEESPKKAEKPKDNGIRLRKHIANEIDRKLEEKLKPKPMISQELPKAEKQYEIDPMDFGL